MPDPNINAINGAITTAQLENTLNLENTGLTDVSSVFFAPGVFEPPRPISQELQTIFEQRYISFDALEASEDGSDLSYLRILEFNNGKFGKQIFPMTSTKDELKYKEFIVTSVQSAFVEKAQIIKTNNTLQVFAFDSQPEVLNIQGVLKSTLTDKWDIGMVLVWDDILRLTKLVQRKLICEFGYESNVYWGYPLNFTHQKSSNSQYVVSYSMQFLIIKRSIVLRNSNPFVIDVIGSLNQSQQSSTDGLEIGYN